MPPHAEIVVGTPDQHFLDAVWTVPKRARKHLRVPLDVGEDPIPAFPFQL